MKRVGARIAPGGDLGQSGKVMGPAFRMAEAGATVPQIASVSGHSIEATQRILETYLPRNRDLAEVAISRFAEYKRQPKVQRESNF